ncbi:molybdopterin-binding protein [Actinomadura sp. HBU206391]|uniref:TOBE domain-containing protein n=1 Tax=Actinomadura sp. HBU206391 TaxID=2731692 RepID=UPI00164F2C8D|nr:TOBE domain-containing protein [Actinomadura sp. HBU206391]MBC6461617.1 helix-turn-helix transcriptional regulator [Actinomadura sp. HBU206391]
MPTYSVGRVAQLLGVSPDTVRRWADAGRLPTRRDEQDHRVVDGRDLAAFAVRLGQDAAGPETPHLTSARNTFPGIVTRVVKDGIIAQVEIQAGPHRVVSLLTSEAVDELGLSEGVEAVARVKSTNVTVDLP